ncbi:PaaI family thioesterase [Sphingomicrobium astaxanthinifaciens]|uniref:PaaI family thioesterase n=1 Tax=Sphingomicrobium astaxanthinifaciens TaxID=1227949 RepID=UPI001FCC7BD9|nr:PaaI family thioesterase [Sphingomicrobium astaxanthinifaciens]MCJ7421743.1 PaaI family thioesterase [Sphingomicrobium astaxanthinifaciens]
MDPAADLDPDLPPYAQLLRLSVSKREGRVHFVMPFHEDVTGRPGFLHGGAIAALLEFAAYATLRDRLGAEEAQVRIKPVTVTVDYMRGGRPRDTHAEAVIERLGRRLANIDAFAWQENRDAPIASARMNVLLERA